MTVDVPISQRSGLKAEQALVQRCLHLFSYLALPTMKLTAQAVAMVAGGDVARVVDPSLTINQIDAMTLAYLSVMAIAAMTQSLVTHRRPEAIWLFQLALLIGFAVAQGHQPRGVEAAGAWFCVVQLGFFLVRIVEDRLRENIIDIGARSRTIAFIGNSDAAAAMMAQLAQDQRPHARIIGFFDDRLNRPGPLTGLIPCLGTIDDLVGYIHDAELSEVYMALPWSAGPRISQLIEQLRFLPLTVRLIPDHVPPALPGRGDGQLSGVVMPTLMVPPFSAAGAILKRGIDVCAALLLLIPLVPLFILVAICLKLDSPGPVLFRQVRSGQFGRPFRIFKFRSLHVAQADTAAETLVVAGDRRVTRVGQVIRKYSIDELPQIFNVLLGQMSLVGPRPHAPRAKADGRIYAEVIPEYMLRYRVKPGMTGWAQVNGWRGNTDTEEQLRKRVEFDFQYIVRWSVWRDFNIILKTIPAMLLPPTQNV